VVTRSRKLVITLVVFAGLICGPFFPNLIAQLLTHLDATDIQRKRRTCPVPQPFSQ
jgi:hypothetical protein